MIAFVNRRSKNADSVLAILAVLAVLTLEFLYKFLYRAAVSSRLCKAVNVINGSPKCKYYWVLLEWWL